ncbi:Integrase, catalytic core protein, partial [Phytophthora megakarya]
MYGQLTELIFMEQPVEFEENGGQLVCQLVKSLYGLKQVLPQDSDYRLYAKYDSDGEVQRLLTVYVEDLLLMRPSDLCAKVANQLKGVFALTSIASKAKVKPRAPDTKLPYCDIVGSLQYLVSESRPDITHVVRHLGKYLSCFEHNHYREHVEIMIYTDCDYANDPDDAKSISGYITFQDGNAISYGSRKQGTNAHSSTETEYVDMNERVKDILWTDGLLEEVRWPAATPLLRGDNQAVLYLAKKPGKPSASKHIQNKIHLIRYLVEDCMLRTLHMPTNDNTADIMTKPLANAKFTKFRKQLQVTSRTTTAELNGETMVTSG